MSYGANQCEHGRLARVCEVCALEKQLAAVTAERDNVRLAAVALWSALYATPLSAERTRVLEATKWVLDADDSGREGT